ncbi:MAG: hypothetical protein Q4F95_00710 [Oscillospiraceae bacterium]|nr:hypothetical protein [Oscillospiraceae bacterium]
MNRLTYSENGRWGVIGMNEQNQDEKLYGVACKLKDYEQCGMDPDELQDMLMFEIKIGSDIQGYVIYGICKKHCIAKRNKTDEYVVWTIDSDRKGVHWGRYFTDINEAEKHFCEVCFDFSNEDEC